MESTPRMRKLHLPLLLGSLLLASSSAGCGFFGPAICYGSYSGDTSSTGGDTDTGGTGGTSGSGVVGSASTGPAEPTLPAVTLTRAQEEALRIPYGSTDDPSVPAIDTSSGAPFDPDDLFLHISDVGASCGSPIADLPCGGHWSLTLMLGKPIRQAGVYDLESPELHNYSYISETGAASSSDPSDCSVGALKPFRGTLEILSIDATAVHFRLTAKDGLKETNLSGEYSAPRCP